MTARASGLSIRSPWQALTPETAARLEAATGVYEIRRDGRIERVGVADSRTAFGLRGELMALAQDAQASDGPAMSAEFRAEVTSTYTSRWYELLGIHLARHGTLPPGPAPDLVRLRPIGTETTTGLS